MRTLRTQAGSGTDAALEIWLRHWSRRQPKGHSCHTGRRVSVLCRLRDRSFVVGSVQHAPVTAVINGFARTSRRDCLRTRSRKFRDARPSNLREVIMTMSEYEEQFRPPAPSLHQTFAEV